MLNLQLFAPLVTIRTYRTEHPNYIMPLASRSMSVALYNGNYKAMCYTDFGRVESSVSLESLSPIWTLLL